VFSIHQPAAAQRALDPIVPDQGQHDQIILVFHLEAWLFE
jgi:hypothetical protein